MNCIFNITATCFLKLFLQLFSLVAWDFFCCCCYNFYTKNRPIATKFQFEIKLHMFVLETKKYMRRKYIFYKDASNVLTHNHLLFPLNFGYVCMVGNIIVYMLRIIFATYTHFTGMHQNCLSFPFIAKMFRSVTRFERLRNVPRIIL